MPTRLSTLLAVILTCSTICICMAQPARTRLVVSASGRGDFKTVQEAVDHATGPTVIAIQPGIYHEKVSISRKGIWLIGLGANPEDVTITFGDSARNTGSTFKSGTVIVDADQFAAENLSMVNTWWDDHPDPSDASQAVALQLSSDQSVLDRVRLLSGQDTLYAASRTCRGTANSGSCDASREYFNDCFIEGNVDYIFGDAKAVFNHCELHSRRHHEIMITAQSKHFPAEESGYYFLNCKITGVNEGDQVVLGRPWRDYATVLFNHTDIEQTLAPEGWSEWGGRLKTATYQEYDSYGPGVNGGERMVKSPPLTREAKRQLNPRSLLEGADGWNPISEAKQLQRLVHRLQ